MVLLHLAAGKPATLLKMTQQDILELARRTLRIESQSIMELESLLNDDFAKTVELLNSLKGRLVISGIGKSAIIGQKIVATLNSTGTPSIFMHAADAIHGDLGMVQQGDPVMVISKSGESPEIKVLVPLIKNQGNTLIAMAGNRDSFLAREADLARSASPSGRRHGRPAAAERIVVDGLLSPDLTGLWVARGRPFGLPPGPLLASPMPTAEGRRAAQDYDQRFDDPALTCSPANIIFGWTHDQNVNQIIQTRDAVTLRYGYMDLVRIIHLDTDVHPKNQASS